MAAQRRYGGFEPASKLLRDRIRKVGEKRGFAVSRVITHWAEIVGADIAAMARPIRVGYGRDGFGATLTLLTTGAQAPMLQMMEGKIREKVNACYGYNAISRVAITQTAPTGFAEGQVEFTPAPKAARAPSPDAVRRAEIASDGIQNDGLRAALESLGQKVLSRPDEQKG